MLHFRERARFFPWRALLYRRLVDPLTAPLGGGSANHLAGWLTDPPHPQ
ncbi:hypothetical protein [Leucobacter sp. OH1287]|nr:hypothetical protein [Leucobacter sp. OH1287]